MLQTQVTFANEDHNLNDAFETCCYNEFWMMKCYIHSIHTNSTYMVNNLIYINRYIISFFFEVFSYGVVGLIPLIKINYFSSIILRNKNRASADTSYLEKSEQQIFQNLTRYITRYQNLTDISKLNDNTTLCSLNTKF